MNRPVAVVLLLALSLNLGGCATWKASQTPLPDLEGKKVRLTTSGGTRGAGKLVAIDSLGAAVLDRGWLAPDMSVDTTAITKIETREFSAGRTALCIPVLAVAFAIEMSILSRLMWED
jgi:hypothetical protein